MPRRSKVHASKYDKTYERPNHRFRNCVFAVFYVILAMFSVFIAFFVIAAFVVGNGAPLALITSAGLTAAQVDQEFKDALAIDDPNSKEFQDFVKTVNLFEDTWNFLVTGLQMLITVFDVSLGVFYQLFPIFLDIALAIFKFIFGTPLRDAMMEVLLWATEALRIVANTATRFAGTDQTFGVANENVPGETEGFVFGAGTGDPGAPVTQFFVWLWNICVKGMANLLIGMGNSVSDFFEMIFNVFLKYLGKIMKTFTRLLETFDVTKLAGKWLQGVTGTFSKITRYLSPSCFQNILQNYGQCAGQEILRAGLNPFVKGLKKLGVNVKNPVKKCDVKNIDNPCAGGTDDPTESVDYKLLAEQARSDDPVFGLGLCDEVQCFEDVSTLLENFRALDQSCDFWTNSTATAFCMVAVRDFSIVNSTSTAEQDIESIGAELCLVLREQVLRRCDIGEPPFSFDIDFVADEICIADKSGSPDPFAADCACGNNAPLCDEDCCEQYARQINGQVLDQLGDRTCAEALDLFRESEVWCPFMDETSSSIPFFGDLGYTHVICNYYHKVFAPACGNPLLRVRDAPVAPFLPAYITDSCVRLVDTVGVCLPIDTSVSDISFGVVEAQDEIDSDEVFRLNNLRTFEPLPIVTFFGDDATPDEIIMKTLDKYYCQQFSIVNNNSNPIFEAQPWSVQSVIGSYCDFSVISALFTVDVSADFTTKLRTEDGDRITGDLEGIPAGTPVFGASMQTNDCTDQTGSNPDEVNEQAVCAARFQTEMNVQTELAATEADMSLRSLGETALQGDDMNHVSGIQDLDPEDPQYARKERELEELDRTTDLNADWETDDPETLRNETAPFRRTFPQPPTGADADNPFQGIIKDTAPGGRTVLSVDPTGADPHAQWAANPHAAVWKGFFQGIIDVIEDKPLFRNKDSKKSLDEWRREKAARIQKKKIDMILQQEGLLGSDAEDEEEDPTQFSYDDTSYASKGRGRLMGRRLQSTGDPILDAQASELIAQLRDIPDTLERTTPDQFAQHQAETATTQMDLIADHLQTIVIPRIFDMFYAAALNGSSAVFGSGTANGGEKKCRATMSDPYRCCDADATAYECCRGLLFCIPLLPNGVFIDRTTAENADKWRCEEFDLPHEYWYTLIRIVTTKPVNSLIENSGSAESILRTLLGWLTFKDNDVPDNSVECLMVKSAYFWFGILAVWGIAVLFSLQMATELTLYYQNHNRMTEGMQDTELVDERVTELEMELKREGVIDDNGQGANEV